VGPRAGLDTAVEKTKESLLLPGSQPGRSAHSLVTILTELRLYLVSQMFYPTYPAHVNFLAVPVPCQVSPGQNHMA